MAGCFCQANVPRNDGVEYLAAKKTAQVCCYLPRKRGPLIIHGEDDPLHGKFRVERASNTHKRVQKLRYAF
jgi:hypothetical protein